MENESDLAFTDATSQLALTRTYNSFDTRHETGGTGAFGPGWSSIVEARLELSDDAARMTHPDGRVVVFPRLGDGWDRATGANTWLDPHRRSRSTGSPRTTARPGTTPPPVS